MLFISFYGIQKYFTLITIQPYKKSHCAEKFFCEGKQGVKSVKNSEISEYFPKTIAIDTDL